MSDISKFLTTLVYKGFESFGRYYSVYRGIVISNEDPKNFSRLSLVIPKVTGENVHPTWAYPKGIFVGKDYGLNLPPQKGDMVWVEFEFGDPEFPIWSYGHYAENEKPIEFTNDTFGFKTPKGNLVLVNDKEDYILIKKKGGLEVKLDKDNKVNIHNKDVDFKTEINNLIQAIRDIVLQTPYGPTVKKPLNDLQFESIKNNLEKLLS